ncbi:hypothetical protein CVT26_010439 [Gymnopilus dilepis]|uniref:F-box domain-containing protein n=1 Tax=Gymnopilus dilepis TaxID=231916 RepID=A0A409Y0H1_9AGAR|nr:hypothetical protein CVT26_010439 [Gymnopilus dilepis]
MDAASPANRLPHELLAYIFTICAADISDHHPVSMIHLTHVSARWRDVALTTQSLWGRITLTFPLSPWQFSYSSAYLKRSGSYPLELLWDLRDPSWDWDEDAHTIGWKEMENVMRLFMPHFTRWRSLELLADNWIPIFAFLWYSKDVRNGPLLESLSLSRCNAYFANPGQTFQPVALRKSMSLFGGIHLPSLRRVSLVGVHIDWSAPCALRNLTQLDFKYFACDVTPTLAQFQSIVEACPLLSSLSICGRGPDIGDVSQHSNQIQLPALQSFSLGFIDTTYAIGLFSLLRMPNLQRLVIEDISKILSPSYNVDASPLLAWFCSNGIDADTEDNDTCQCLLSKERVQDLELEGVQAPKEQFRSFLRSFPSIRRLSLTDIADDLLSLLVSGVEANPSEPQAGHLLPALRELRCQDVNAETLIEAVTSRTQSNPHVPLQASLKAVRFLPPPSGTLLYRRLDNAGIKIVEDI